MNRRREAAVPKQQIVVDNDFESDEVHTIPSETLKTVLDNISFNDDLQKMLHGFGDSVVPLDETISLMDKLVKDFIVQLTMKSLTIAKNKHMAMDATCIQFSVRKMPDYIQRIKELLVCYDEIMPCISSQFNDAESKKDMNRVKRRKEARLSSNDDARSKRTKK